jgi:hypothetical protein
MQIRMISLAAFAVAMLAGTQASAAPPPGTFETFNTGVDDSHHVLANGATETHYTASDLVWGGTVPQYVETSAVGWPIAPNGPWLGDNNTSRWIGPSDQADWFYYDYQTTFTLTGYEAARAVINGRWSTDDYGWDILINGQSTGNWAGDFSNWYNFSVTSGFVTGTNTLDFIVYNTGGPGGLRVEMAGGVPEPASWAMMLGGFGLVGGAMRSRRKAAVSFG